MEQSKQFQPTERINLSFIVRGSRQKGFNNICCLAVLLLLVLSCWSCKKNSDQPVADTSNNEVKALVQIDNAAAAYDFNVTGAAAKINPIYPSSATYHMEAIDANNRMIFISISGLKGKGNYPFTSDQVTGPGNSLRFTIINPSGSGLDDRYWTIDPSITNKGSFTVTFFSKNRIEGTFTAICKNNAGTVASITNGTFKGNF